MSEGFEYNAFLAYSSIDKKWAEALQGDLVGRGCMIFRDKVGLLPGDNYLDKLGLALRASQHLIVLGSLHSAVSDEVEREIKTFRKHAGGAHRRVIPLMLDDAALNLTELVGENAHWEALVEGVQSGDFLELYTHRPAWLRALRKVEDILRSVPNTVDVPVGLVVLTLKQQEVANLGSADWEPLEKKFPDYFKALAIDISTAEGVEKMRRRFPEKRLDWQPAEGMPEVREILDRVTSEVNRRAPQSADGRRARMILKEMPEEFYESADDEPECYRFIKELRSECAYLLVLVDALSLAIPCRPEYKVADLFRRFDYRDEHVTFLFPSPKTVDWYSPLTDMVRKQALNFQMHFFESEIDVRGAKGGYAHLGFNLFDEREFGRLLSTGIGRDSFRIEKERAADARTSI